MAALPASSASSTGASSPDRSLEEPILSKAASDAFPAAKPGTAAAGCCVPAVREAVESAVALLEALCCVLDVNERLRRGSSAAAEGTPSLGGGSCCLVTRRDSDRVDHCISCSSPTGRRCRAVACSWGGCGGWGSDADLRD